MSLSTMPGVYSIFCHADKKFYVGGAVNVRDRMWQHFKHLVGDNHINKNLQRAWIKYGSHQFQPEVLERCEHGNVRAREQAWLDSIKESKVPVFNMHFDATGMLGFKHSDESKRKISEALCGKPHSDEHKRKLSEANRKRIWSEKSKAKISESLRKSPKVQQALKRMSLNKRGKPISDETKARIRESVKKSWITRRLRTLSTLKTPETTS